MDSPTVFRKGRKWFMTYIIYDGRGYETWLASSKNLLNWKTEGKLMSFSDTWWDDNQKAGYNALQNPRWGGSYKLNKFSGKYWMSYLGGNGRGYEAGSLAIGMAYAKKHPSEVQEWERLKQPILKPQDTDAGGWENKKLYKSTVIEDKNRLTGHRFVMYYNANGDSVFKNNRSDERIGIALSNDMVKWERFYESPLLYHDGGITGDAVIQKINTYWVMFYFGAFWQNSEGAFNRFAVSEDLINWTDWDGDNLVEPSESFDELFAHKSFVVKHRGIVYHYYCAVNKKEQRGIAVATSKYRGKSKLDFVEPD